MQKIISQVQDASLPYVGLVSTKKVVEILENNKRKSGNPGRYAMLFIDNIVLIGNITKIDNATKVLDILGQTYSRSDDYTRDWYNTRKKHYREGKLKGVVFL